VPPASSPHAAELAIDLASIDDCTCSQPYQPDVSDIPKQALKNRTLSFQKSWYSDYPWLHYKPSVLGVVCFYCATAEHLELFGLSRNREDAFITAGFRNWKKALDRFNDHSRCRSHQFAVEQVAHLKSAEPVDSQLSTQRNAEQREAQINLIVIVTSIKYLARQGLALRGHDSDDGNFQQLLLLRCSDNPSMRRWLERKVAFTSPQAQNEILQLFSHAIVREIAARTSRSRCFAIIVDGTQDISRKEQLSMCLRYVDADFVPHEDFIGLYEPPDTSGATIASCIKDVLLRLNLSLANLRGQTYDGAANMSGQYRGCQAIIAGEQPLATYVHCGAHCTNLVMQFAAEACPLVRDAMQVLNELGSLFSMSLTARTAFQHIATDSEFGNLKQIRPLCQTRWLVRVKAIETVTSQYDAVLLCLEQLSAPGNHVAAKASGLLHSLRRGSTMLAFEIGLRVFKPLETLNRATAL